MRTDINWELLKFKHEILGVTKDELSREYQITTGVMQEMTEDWDQLPLAKQKMLDVRDFKDLNEVSDDFKNQVAEQARVASIIKQKFIGPKYIELEMTLLTKALQLAEKLDASDKASANSIRTLTTVLEDLLKQNTILDQSKVEDDKNDNVKKVWEVHIVEAKSETTGTE